MSTFDPIKESHLIGNLYMHPDYGTYRLEGILLGEDDWYWHLVAVDPKQHPRIYNGSCVGDIEGHGFSLVEDYANTQQE